jgi:O-antigen ligase
VNETPVRRPGGLARFACLVAAGVAYLEVFAIGFPPASRARLPLLLLSAGLAAVAAWNRGNGLALFAFLFPLAGLGDRLAGGSDAIAWPILLFLGLAAGWTFRFLYDFETAPDPTRADRILRALLVLWTLSAALAVVRARTLWAIVRGLKLRAVNVEGLPDALAIRASLLSYAALAGGAALFFLARRAGRADRQRALRAALGGTVLSALVAVAERLGAFATETSPFWKIVGRYSGAAGDPNALGILCGGGAVIAASLAASSRGGARIAASLALAPLAAGLALSGSRSGLSLAGLGLVVLLAARSIVWRVRVAVFAAAVLLVGGVALSDLAAHSGGVAARFRSVLDERVPLDFRVSTRPLLWESAARLFAGHPVEGAGVGAFTWQLPNLLAENGRSLGGRTDNPGNAYLQALAETGLIGFALTVFLAAALAREAARGLRDPARPGLEVGAAAAVLGFLAVLLIGSHWLAPDSAFFFFLAASVAAGPPPAVSSPSRAARWLPAALAAYAVAAAVSAAGTARSDVAFRYRPEIGFHAAEKGPGGLFRWTQRRFAVRVPAGEAWDLALAHYTPEGMDVKLETEVDGRPEPERAIASGQSVRLRLESPQESARVYRFALSRAFVPRWLGVSGDHRELGVVAILERAR